MATLILYGNEKLDSVLGRCDCYDEYYLDLDKIDVIIHKEGKETKILKSPHDSKSTNALVNEIYK